MNAEKNMSHTFGKTLQIPTSLKFHAHGVVQRGCELIPERKRSRANDRSNWNLKDLATRHGWICDSQILMTRRYKIQVTFQLKIVTNCTSIFFPLWWLLTGKKRHAVILFFSSNRSRHVTCQNPLLFHTKRPIPSPVRATWKFTCTTEV